VVESDHIFLMNIYTRTIFLLGTWFGIGWTAIYTGVKDFYDISGIDWYLFLGFIAVFLVSYIPIVTYLDRKYKLVKN